MSRRGAVVVAVAGALALGVATLAAGVPTQSAAAESSSDYRIGDTQPVDSVNPFREQNEISYDITSLSYDLLLNYRTSDIQPDLDHSLAKSFKVSSDGKTWTFRLHSGIKWSDGVPFSSADVKWTYDAVRANTTNVMNAYLAEVSSVQAPNSTTVILKLSSPDVRIPSIFVPILPKHVFDKYPVKKLDKINLPLPSVTTAAYRIKSYNKRGTTILVANPHFREDKPSVQRILVTNYGNDDSLLRDLQGNKLDMIVDGNVQWASKFHNDKDIHQWSGAAPGFTEIAFNSCPPAGAGQCSGLGKDVHAKVVQDHAIREALAYGVDRKNISQTNYAGQNRPAYGLISPYYASYFKDWSTDPNIGYKFNHGKAKEVLKKGGWDCSSNPCTKDGQKAEFTLYVRTNDEPGQNAMRRVVAWASQLGIKITLSIVSEDALNNKIYAPGKGGKYAPDFDAFYWAWTGDPTPDFNFSVLQTGSAWSDSYYSNPIYDQVTKRALGTTDMGQRVALLHQAEKIAMTDLPYIPIVYSSSYDLTRTGTWHDYQASPSGAAGSPIGTNWLQITMLKPGPGANTSATTGSSGDSSGANGVSLWFTILVAVITGVIGVLVGRRTRTAATSAGGVAQEDADDAPFA